MGFRSLTTLVGHIPSPFPALEAASTPRSLKGDGVPKEAENSASNRV